MRYFVLCVVAISLHGKIAFHRGHVYIAQTVDKGDNYSITCEFDTLEIFPKEYFESNFKVMSTV